MGDFSCNPFQTASRVLNPLIEFTVFPLAIAAPGKARLKAHDGYVVWDGHLFSKVAPEVWKARALLLQLL